ncbi:DUF58 domain-containing protein [Agromyces marinus]|uniref:Lipoprotein n=1 Tax=Agromyces marinus TaxID=1389020 RepID=A0ABM8GYY1_9MICO|nr:DUF58 domain-containing protein [Agromyces marinus]UIP58071.1 hypothetical protein DSM26151_09410 [Agromyces marinus]BDZ53705.1 lipoprotein [Agromyces marinus]
MALTGRFAALLAVGAVPVVLLGGEPGVAWAVLAGWLALVVALGAADLALAASPRRVALERDLPARVRLGETVRSELVVRNLGERMLRAEVRDGWQPSAGVQGRNRARVDVPSGEGRRIVLALRPTRRGDRTSAAVTIRSHGPLGLWARQATLAAPGRLRVLPPFHSRAHLPARLTRLRELDGRTPMLVRGQGTEFDSLREYVRGDDVRSIDWRATARRSDPEAPGAAKLMVRTWRPERDRRIVIVVDTSRTAAARIGDEPRLDTAYEAALLLAALASHAGDRVDLLLWDRRLRGRVHGANGADLLARMVDAMADVDAELIEADWAGVPAQVRQVTSRRALVVLLTAADSPGSARGLLAVLPQLTARHRVVVASVADPALADAAERRGDLAEAYAAAAAERSRLDADRVAAAVRRLGADTVAAGPADLPPALADRYLDLKATGRL